MPKLQETHDVLSPNWGMNFWNLFHPLYNLLVPKFWCIFVAEKLGAASERLAAERYAGAMSCYHHHYIMYKKNIDDYYV